MPAVPRPCVESVAYLYVSEEDAEAGHRDGGTGFLVGVPHGTSRYSMHSGSSMGAYLASDPPRIVYCVTARHVVDGGATIVRTNTSEGPLVLTTGEWVRHEDLYDVAVCLLGLASDLPGVGFIPIEYAAKETDVRFFYPGDDAFFVGRFADQDGYDRIVPTTRFGNLSVQTVQPVYNQKRDLTEPSFLVEMRSLSGYSGSPVYLYKHQLDVSFKEDDIEASEVAYTPVAQVWLLGVDWCHLTSAEPVLDPQGQPAELVVRSNSGMMGVVPAWRIVETLEQEDAVASREAIKEQWQAR